MNFAPHIHDFDLLTYRCRICGLGEFELLQAEGSIRVATEAEQLASLLQAAGYKVTTDPTQIPTEPLIPIKEAVKDAPKHWP